MSKIVEFIPERIVRRKISGKSVECLFYSLITEDGEYITDRLISLDKVWFKACRGPKPYIGKWVKIEYYSKKHKYGFPDPERASDAPYILYTELIDMVDFVVSHIVEKEVLGCNLKLDLNSRRFYV